MKIDKKFILISFVSAFLFILALFFKYNDFTKTYYILLILSLSFFTYLVYKTLFKNNRYEKNKKLNKFLKEYKSIIVYVETYNFRKKEIIELDNYTELVDKSIELKKPIIYIKKDNEDIFFVDSRKIFQYRFK